MKELVRYYETYFELYGRKVNLVTFEGTGNATDEVAARADAAQIAEEFKPFAVFGGPALTSAFADELAAHQVICIGCTPGQPRRSTVDRDPYVWGLDGSPTQKQNHVVEFLTKQIIGKNAEHGGDAVKDQPRKFGLLYLENSGAAKELADAFAADMAAAGSPFAEVIAYQLDPTTIQATATQVITKLKAAGVTTIVFSGDPVAPRDFTKEATAQEYFPEWVISASTLVDVTAFARTYDQEQWKHAFGVTQLAARTPTDQIGSFFYYKWFTGQDPPADGEHRCHRAEPGAVLRGPPGCRSRTSPPRRSATLRSPLPGTSDGLVISQPFLTYGDHGYWPDDGLPGRRRCHVDLVGSRRDGARRDPQGGRGHVPVRRRRPAIPARRMADRGQAVRPGRSRDDLHLPAPRRSPRQLPEPRRLTPTESRLLGEPPVDRRAGRPRPGRRWCG